MKNKLLLLTIICFPFLASYSQLKAKKDTLISAGAFNKMIHDYYNFTLVGSQTPATGFKIETNKPSIGLKGNIFSNSNRSLVANLEIEGGLENNIMQLFAGNTLNTYFKGSIGLNILQGGNSAKFLTITRTERNLNEHAFRNNKTLLATQLDTFIVIKTITDDANFESYDFNAFVAAVIAERSEPEFLLPGVKLAYKPEQQSTYFRGLAKGVLVLLGAKDSTDENSVWKDFTGKITSKSDGELKSKKLLEDYDRLKAHLLKDGIKTLNGRQHDFEIKLTEVLWTVKAIRWWNISLSASNSNFKLYDAGAKLLTDSNSFLPSLSVSHNWLRKGKAAGQFSYCKAGAAFHIKTNSIADMQKYNYKKETTIAVGQGEELKSTKEGIAYQGDFLQKPGFDVFAEWYCVPWRTVFIPGLYVKAMYRHSEAWINKSKLSGDIGMVWNVANNDKDAKNLLTIVPYVSWSNFIKEYKDAEKTRERKLSDLFSVNVKFSIPVNLGK